MLSFTRVQIYKNIYTEYTKNVPTTINVCIFFWHGICFTKIILLFLQYMFIKVTFNIIKMTTHYYITGVWKDKQKRITDVMLHQVYNDGSFETRGRKSNKKDVIQLIKNGKVIKTLVWNYPGWIVGAVVTYETVNNEEYLRSVKDASTKNNLDNSLQMECFLD